MHNMIHTYKQKNKLKRDGSIRCILRGKPILWPIVTYPLTRRSMNKLVVQIHIISGRSSAFTNMYILEQEVLSLSLESQSYLTAYSTVGYVLCELFFL